MPRNFRCMRNRTRLAVSLLVLLFVVASCGSADGATGDQVVGTWALEGLAVDGAVVPMAIDLAPSSIRFSEDGRVEGRAPCNDFAGRWSYDDGLAITGLTQSAAACADPGGGERIMAAESALLGALFTTDRFEIRRESDVLQMSSGSHVLTWRLVQP